jgi:hypothetical protein
MGSNVDMRNPQEVLEMIDRMDLEQGMRDAQQEKITKVLSMGQRQREINADQVTQAAIAGMGEPPVIDMEQGIAQLSNGAVINLGDPEDVMQFVDDMYQMQDMGVATEGEGKRPLQQMPAMAPQQQPSPRQAGPETPPIPAGAAVARRR